MLLYLGVFVCPAVRLQYKIYKDFPSFEPESNYDGKKKNKIFKTKNNTKLNKKIITHKIVKQKNNVRTKELKKLYKEIIHLRCYLDIVDILR